MDDPLFYEGTKYPGTCMVFWPRVYAWTASGYTDVSPRYPQYYEAELRSTHQKIAAIKSAETTASTSGPGELDCLKVEAAKMERFLNLSKGAGMADAIRWANSNRPDQRELAAWFLGDIGTPNALEYERTLSLDSDHQVADVAKLEVKNWGEHQKPIAFERLPIMH